MGSESVYRYTDMKAVAQNKLQIAGGVAGIALAAGLNLPVVSILLSSSVKLPLALNVFIGTVVSVMFIMSIIAGYAAFMVTIGRWIMSAWIKRTSLKSKKAEKQGGKASG